jgi:hypothetical protein
VADCVIEFYQVGTEKPAAIVQLTGNHSLEDINDRCGVMGKLKLLSDAIRHLDGSTTDPEWAAAEYITLFRKIGDNTVKVAVRRKPTAEFVIQVKCTPAGLKPTVLRKAEGDTFRKVA